MRDSVLFPQCEAPTALSANEGNERNEANRRALIPFILVILFVLVPNRVGADLGANDLNGALKAAAARYRLRPYDLAPPGTAPTSWSEHEQNEQNEANQTAVILFILFILFIRIPNRVGAGPGANEVKDAMR